MNSDSESLAFVEEEDGDFMTPNAARLSAAGDNGTKPPLHNRGGSPSVFVAPTKKSSGGEKPLQHRRKRSSSLASNGSIAFQVEEEPTPVASAARGGRLVPQKKSPSAARNVPVDNGSISFQVDEFSEGLAGLSRANTRRGSNATLVSLPNDSLSFQMEEDSGGTGKAGSSGHFHRPTPTAQGLTHTPRGARKAAAKETAVSNDSIAFHVEEETSPVGKHPKPRPLTAERVSKSASSAVFRLPELPHIEGNPEVDSHSIALQIEDSSILFNSGTDALHSPPGARPLGPLAGETGHSQIAHADASASSIQFATDTEGGENYPVMVSQPQPAQPFVRTPSGAGSSVSANYDLRRQKKTVVSNHMKNSSTGNSPARLRPSPKISSQSQPPLTQPKRNTYGLSVVADRKGPATPAEAAEAARRASAEADEREAARALVPAGVDLPKRRRKVRNEAASSTSKARRRSSSDTSGASAGKTHRPRRKHRVPRSSSSAQRRHQRATATDQNRHDPPETPREASTVATENDQSDRDMHTSSMENTSRQVSESVPNTVRTQEPGQLKAQRSRHGSSSSHDSASRIATKHLDHTEARNGYFLKGNETARRASVSDAPGDAGRRSSRSATLLLPPPSSDHREGGGVHKRTNTNVFIDPITPGDLIQEDGRAADEAVQQTEMWRAFNDAQRVEIERLQKRIAAAKRQDRTLLGENVGAASSPSVAMPAGVVKRPVRSEHVAKAPLRSLNRGSSGNANGYAARNSVSPAPRQIDVVAAPRPAAAQPTQQGSDRRRNRAAASPSPKPSRGAPNPHPTRLASFPVDDVASASTVASLLGIAWPPSRPGDLYFVTGSRLTQQQVENFYDTVKVQLQHDEQGQLAARTAPGALAVMSPTRALRAQTRHSLSPSRSTSATAKSARRNRRPVARRGQVLREVFDLLDCNKRGFLYAREIPALRHLVESQIAKLEAPSPDGAGGKNGRPVHRPSPSGTLLDAAAKHHCIYANAYSGLSRPPPRHATYRSILPGYDTLSPSPTAAAAEESGVSRATRMAVLLSFAVNVVLPLAASSRIDALDFPTLSLVVLGAIDKNDPALARSAEGQAWRQVVAQYFEALSQ